MFCQSCEDKEGQGDGEEGGGAEEKIVPKWKPTDVTEVYGETGVLGLIEAEKRKQLEDLAAATVAAIEKAAADQYAEELRLAALAEEEEEEDEMEESQTSLAGK